MAWSRVDDNLPIHPRIVRAWQDYWPAIGLWPMGLAWSARTDGEVSTAFVRGLIPGARQRDRTTGTLVDAGLWVPNGAGGWQIHDWADYNSTRAQVEERKRADRDRKRAGIR